MPSMRIVGSLCVCYGDGMYWRMRMEGEVVLVRNLVGCIFSYDYSYLYADDCHNYDSSHYW